MVVISLWPIGDSVDQAAQNLPGKHIRLFRELFGQLRFGVGVEFPWTGRRPWYYWGVK